MSNPWEAFLRFLGIGHRVAQVVPLPSRTLAPVSPVETPIEAPPPVAPVETPPPKQNVEGGLIPGFDVAHFQPNFDWDAAARLGYKFAFAEATNGASGVDSMFKYHRANAHRVGMIFGAYHFFRFDDSIAAQLENFLNVTGGVGENEFPLCVDVEWDNKSADRNYHDSDHDGRRGTMDEAAAAKVYEFTRALAQAIAARPILYTNYFFFTGFQKPERFSDCIPWICNYTAKDSKKVLLPPPWTKLVFWQDNAKLSFAGETNIDGNKFVGSLDDLQNLAKKKAIQ